MDFNERVYAAIRKIPAGKVATYGDIAVLVGSPRSARQVGRALHFNPRPIENPCHRVVFADGSLASAFAFGGEEVQKSLLEAEGVEVGEGFKVDLGKYRWDGR